MDLAIFDVDGTLVDSNDFHVEAWRRAFREYGRELTADEVHAQMGKGGDQLMPVFLSRDELERFGAELEERRVRMFVEEYLPRVRPFRCVPELFRRLREDGWRIVLASSAKEKELARHIETLRVRELIDGATSADDADHSKPCPDIFQAALAKVPAERSGRRIVVGDTPYDAQAAAKLRLPTIGVLSGGFTRRDLAAAGALAVYRDIAELLERYDETPFAVERAWT